MACQHVPSNAAPATPRLEPESLLQVVQQHKLSLCGATPGLGMQAQPLDSCPFPHLIHLPV